MLAGVRKATKKLGDDVSLTRWIKIPSEKIKRLSNKSVHIPSANTLFTTRILSVENVKSLLVSGYSSIKLGRDVRKGKLRGYWIYSLSLEERKTCPTSCLHWTDCYGNNMPFAKRIDHTDVNFLNRLEAEIFSKLAVRGRKGILIRLHALGDFYSVEYVRFWIQMIEKYKNLVVFGYTAHEGYSAVGKAIKEASGERFRIRFSDGARWGETKDITISIKRAEDVPKEAFICPEQTGKTKACATCGACWYGNKPVAFIDH